MSDDDDGWGLLDGVLEVLAEGSWPLWLCFLVLFAVGIYWLAVT